MSTKQPNWLALKDALQLFSRAAIKMVKDIVSRGAAIPVHSETVPVRNEHKQWTFETKETALVGTLLVTLGKNLKALPEYKRCESILLNDPQIASYVNQLMGTPHHPPFSPERTLFAILVDQLVDGSLEFHEERFDQTYEKVQEYIFSKSERCVGWVPLKNFTSDLDEIIIINPALSIRRLPDTVIKEFYLHGGSGSLGGTSEVLQWTHGIYAEYELPRIFGEIVEPSDKSLELLRARFERPVEDVIRALRLIKNGMVGIGPALMIPQTWSPDTGPILGYGNPDVPFTFRGPYALVNGDVSLLLSLFLLVRSLDRNKFSFLELALRRFNQSYGRVGAEDRLIDYMIAFEALYLNDTDAQGRGEMRFRLALRVAQLLRKQDQQRRSLYREMRAAYDMRSSIVHGDRGDAPKVDGVVIPVEEFVSRVENYLRESLLKFLKKAQEPNAKKKLVSWEDLLFPHSLNDN